jgi:hypothetical protein
MTVGWLSNELGNDNLTRVAVDPPTTSRETIASSVTTAGNAWVRDEPSLRPAVEAGRGVSPGASGRFGRSGADPPPPGPVVEGWSIACSDCRSSMFSIRPPRRSENVRCHQKRLTSLLSGCKAGEFVWVPIGFVVLPLSRLREIRGRADHIVPRYFLSGSPANEATAQQSSLGRRLAHCRLAPECGSTKVNPYRHFVLCQLRRPFSRSILAAVRRIPAALF